LLNFEPYSADGAIGSYKAVKLKWSSSSTLR